MESLQFTSICPSCNAEVEYIPHPLIRKMQNSGNGGEPVTFSQMWKVILITRHQQRFGRRYCCSRCGKHWREAYFTPTD